MQADVFSLLRDKTIPQWLEFQAKRYPFHLAASLPAWAGYRDRLTYAQLVQRMRRMACALYGLGVRRSHRVALFLANRASREAVFTALGCWRLGAAISPLNRRYSDEELSHALHLIEPDMIVAHDQGDAERLQRLCRHRCSIVVLDAAPGQWLAWPEPAGMADAALPADCPVSAEATSCLLFTSGTTARSKAVVHNHRSQLHAGAAMGSATELAPGDAYQGAFPLYTSSAFNLACMSAWAYGAAVVLEEDGLSNEGRLRIIETECTTVYHGVPAVLHFMIEAYVQGAYDVARVRRVAYGGAAIAREVIDLYQRHWPQADQVQVWGMTETGPAGTALPARMLATHAGAIGIPQAGCRIRLVGDIGPDQVLHDVPRGEIGEIAFAGPSAAQGYWNDPAASAETFIDGWVLSGDFGREDEEGVFHYVDRKKDIVNRGGMKIASVAVEDVLYRHESVAEAAVIGVPHTHLGEAVAACLVAKPGMRLDFSELAGHCRRHLADYEVPQYWFVMDALPRNPMGKVQKRVLREKVTQPAGQGAAPSGAR